MSERPVPPSPMLSNTGAKMQANTSVGITTKARNVIAVYRRFQKDAVVKAIVQPCVHLRTVNTVCSPAFGCVQAPSYIVTTC